MRQKSASRKDSRQLVSIVTIAYNEEKNLGEFFSRVNVSLPHDKKYQFEIFLIDNCSTDHTREVALSLIEGDSRWKYIRFSRNFGAEASLAAGLHHAQGDAVILLMSDLQDPPEKIPEMLSIWEDTQCDVVYGVLEKRNDENLLKTVGAKIAYWLIRSLGEVDIPSNATDYRLLSKRVVHELRVFPERVRYLRGLVHWLGFRQEAFFYDRAPRKRGKSSANLLFCIGYALTAVASMSIKPLRLASVLGLAMTALSLVGFAFYLTLWLTISLGYLEIAAAPPGWTTIALLVLGAGGMQFLLLGVLGEYLGQIFLEVKGRPRWVIDDSVGVKSSGEADVEKETRKKASA